MIGRRGARAGVSLVASLALLLAACQSVAPSPSPTPIPTPTPVPTPSPTPEPPSEDEVIAAFLAIVLDPAMTTHVVVDGTVTVGDGTDSATLTIGMDMDIQGEDGIGQAVVDVGAGTITIDMLVVANVAYLDDDGTWVEIPDYEQTTPLNPFGVITGPADVAYVRSEANGSRRVHRLESLVWMGGRFEDLAAQGWTDLEIVSDTAEIWAEDDGTPIRLEFAAEVTGAFAGTPATVEFEIAYDFTDVGEPVDIPSPL